MIHCAYCEKPLICETCQVEYVPPTEDHYRALSQPDTPVTCIACGEILVCHWCKTPYDGASEGEDETESA
jgi:RNase P subunit RPR2